MRNFLLALMLFSTITPAQVSAQANLRQEIATLIEKSLESYVEIGSIQAPPMEVLAELSRYKTDPNEKIRSKVEYFIYSVGKRSEEIPVKQEVVRLLLECV